MTAKATETFQWLDLNSIALKPYDKVRIVSNRFRDQGAPPGTIGYIIEQWRDDWFEIEVSRADGTTIAMFAARADELELAEPEGEERAGRLGPA